MPDKDEKLQQQFRLSAGVVRRLNALADEMELDRADVVDMAIKHLYGSRKRDIQPFVWDPPPPTTEDTPRGKKGTAS